MHRLVERRLAALFALVLLWAAAGCGGNREMDAAPAADGSPTAGLAGTRWVLVELGGAPVALPEPEWPTLEFAAAGEEMRASGSTGCNTFFGSYETGTGGALRFGTLATTRRGCPEPQMAREQAYMRALGETTRYAVGGNGLTLFAGARAVARFRARAGA